MDGSSTHTDGTREGHVLYILQVEQGSRPGAPRRILGGSRVVRIGSMRKDAPPSPRTGCEGAGKRPQQREEGMHHLHWWGQHRGDDHGGTRAGKGGKNTGLQPPPPWRWSGGALPNISRDYRLLGGAVDWGPRDMEIGGQLCPKQEDASHFGTVP